MRRIATTCVLAVLLAAAGCGGSAPPGSKPDTGAPSGAGAEDPDAPGEYNVTINTRSGSLYIDKLELEFNRRRGIHAFYGFFEDQIDRLTTVPFADLERLDILEPMSHDLFDQAVLGREEMNLRRDQAFETRLYYKDQSTARFYAIIPKLRGEKDYQIWELPMTNNAAAIEFIEFNR
jgi:hypothetical protein